MKRISPWVIFPLVILALLLVAFFFRWDTVLIHKTDEAQTMIHMKDRWTQQKWVAEYGRLPKYDIFGKKVEYNTNPYLSGVMRPVINDEMQTRSSGATNEIWQRYHSVNGIWWVLVLSMALWFVIALIVEFIRKKKQRKPGIVEPH